METEMSVFVDAQICRAMNKKSRPGLSSCTSSFWTLEDLVVTLDDQTQKEASNRVELTCLAHEGNDFLHKDERESFDVVHQTNEEELTSENVSANEFTSNVQKSTKYDECGSMDKNNTLTPKRGCGESLIVHEREDFPPTECDVDSVVKKEKPWTFGYEASAGEDSWKDPVPHGLKECFCPHGIVSVQAGHFHCQECGFSSVYKNSIMRHEVMQHRVKHSSVKIMQCKLCPSIFLYSSELRRHSQKHALAVVSDCKGKEEKSSDFEIPQQDSSVTPSSALGSVETNPAADCASSVVETHAAATDGCQTSTRKRRSSNGVIADELQLLKKVRRNNSSEKRSSHKVKNRQVIKRTRQSGRSNKAETEIAREVSTEKINWFCGNVKRNGLSPEIPSNAFVSNHVCTSACICGMASTDKMPSKTKHKNKKIPVEKCSEGIESTFPSKLFQPVIVDSFSCLPSTWTNISDINSNKNGSVQDKASKDFQFEDKSCKTEPNKKLPSQFASNTTKAIKFFQNTSRTVFTTSLQNTLKPQQTVPQIKPCSQVGLKSTYQQTYRRLKNSADDKTSLRPHKTTRNEDLHDINHSIIIRLSDDEGDSSLSATVALDSGICKTEPGMVGSKSAAGSSEQVHNKTFNSGDFNSADVRQLVDTSILICSKNRRSVNTPSTSRSVDVPPTEKSLLSDFDSDVLCNELQKRGFMKRCTCGVFFLSLPTYNLHCAWHSSESPLQCSFCKAITKDWYEFYAHIQNHLNH